MASSRKRKQRPQFDTTHNRFLTHDDARQDELIGHEIDPSLFIQAYEADIIRGPQVSQAAASLEVFDYETGTTLPGRKIGDALIQWGGNEFGKPPAFPGDEDEADQFDCSKQTTEPRNEEKNAVWVDRYDARLLLDALPVYPRFTDATKSLLDSPGGWSDLPSDSEDAFFFSPEEAEDFRRDKKRRLLDQNREKRLRARRIEDGESSDGEEEETWGGSDEEPDDTQTELMRRTAQHILSSPNPAQLEMRILANHGGDKKFAFLRGRWSRAWMTVKGKAKKEKDDKEREQKKGSGLEVLAGYGDSEDESENNGPEGVYTSDNREAEDAQGEGAAGGHQKALDDDAVKMARRARAKEWAKKRRASENS